MRQLVLVSNPSPVKYRSNHSHFATCKKTKIISSNIQIFDLWDTFWLLKSLILNWGSKLGQKAHQNTCASIFKTTNFPIYNLVILSISVAFLALMALKLKNNQNSYRLISNGQENTIKLQKIQNLPIRPLY